MLRSTFVLFVWDLSNIENMGHIEQIYVLLLVKISIINVHYFECLL